MPSRRFHQTWARKQGYSGEVDDFIDGPWAFLGRGHRILHHTYEEAFWIGYMIDGEKGAIGGMMHVWFDRAASADPNFRLFCEMWANSQSTSRKKEGGYTLTSDVKKAHAWIIQNEDIEPRQKVKKARAVWI